MTALFLALLQNEPDLLAALKLIGILEIQAMNTIIESLNAGLESFKNSTLSSVKTWMDTDDSKSLINLAQESDQIGLVVYPIADYVDAFQASGMKAAADSLETTTTNFTSLIEESREEIFRIPSPALKLEFEDVCTNYVLGELTQCS